MLEFESHQRAQSATRLGTGDWLTFFTSSSPSTDEDLHILWHTQVFSLAMKIQGKNPVVERREEGQYILLSGPRSDL